MRLVFSALLLLAASPDALRPAFAQEVADREYVLETNMLGYWGVGGAIDGVRNPTLRAKKGETVRIVIVNLEPLAHDLALETMQIKTKEILDVGERAHLAFAAEEDDIYYCAIPGHRAAGMEGRFEIIREAGAEGAAERSAFDKTRLDDEFFAEGGAIGDLNGDGAADLVAGPYWYAGPEFEARHAFYEPSPFSIRGFSYSDNFIVETHDFNDDGWNDILVIGFPGKEAFWYENPGKPDAEGVGYWTRRLALPRVDNESPRILDLTGNGRPEIVSHVDGYLGYASYDPERPNEPWTFRQVAGPYEELSSFSHGFGVGDVNGDAAPDLLMSNGWWENPGFDADASWRRHEEAFALGGAQMYAYDVDGDGLNDVITSRDAHGWGLSWFRQLPDGGFEKRIILREDAANEPGRVRFSQLHAVALADMDGDGLKDIVTGKRFRAHGESMDPEPNAPPVLYWFRLARTDNGGVVWTPHLIDDDSGVGVDLAVKDANGDGYPDILVVNKKGAYIFRRRAGHAGHAGHAPRTGERSLNLDFETGDLTDWTVEGEAFGNEPVEGDLFASGEAAVAEMIQALRKRRGQEPAVLRSGHRGLRWVSSGTFHGPAGQGTLRSSSFEITHPYASFLISGGALESTRAELVRADDGVVVFSTSGDNDLALRPVVADLKKHVGETIFIRLVDEDAGGSTAAYIPENAYAHVNFDHFRLHAERPSFLNELDPSGIARLPAWDPVLLEGASGQEAAQAMTVPDGFRVQLAAAEPDVVNPIAMALDHRGRAWVAEGRTYPVRAPEGEGKDRILIFEDTDGDGVFDERKIFMEGLNLVSGLELGFGGVWIGAAPYLLFVPIDASGDRPAGPPETLLDGFGYHDTHETLNSFMWGPDGWLYGAHGVFTHSNVGAPGAEDADREKLNAGVWRYHPTRRVFEVFAYGTSNPWGLDWDAHGQLFLTACVIPHLHHAIPGARMIRQAGEHFNPYVYDDLDPIGDHVHWAGDLGPHAGNRRSGAMGGGHAHAGAMIYQGGSWPETYHGRIFMHNIHGFRANTDILERSGSGYAGRHAEDFLLTHDSWSQMLDLVYGPDGSVHVIDWYDKNQCHHGNPESHDHETGRIYRISHENDKWVPVDLERLSSLELVELQMHPNDWYVRTARRILQHRGPDEAVREALWTRFEDNPDDTRKLRALWALHVTGGLSDEALIRLLDHENEHVRAWAIHLLAEDRSVPEEAARAFARMAGEDASALVRLYVASALQRMPPDERWDALDALTKRAEDADDQNIPLMAWYALEPLAAMDMRRALDMALSAELPRILPFTISRIAATGKEEALALLSEYLDAQEDADKQAAIIDGLNRFMEQAEGGGQE